MANLLAVHRLRTKAMQRKSNVPLILEFHVNDATAPYLVSSSSSVMWINEAHPNGVVKAAVRQVGHGNLFAEMVETVATMGRNMNWGNVQPLTTEGLREAVNHIEFYGLGPVELLTPRAHPTEVGEMMSPAMSLLPKGRLVPRRTE